jgi:arylsulfatase A-like enzyme
MPSNIAQTWIVTAVLAMACIPGNGYAAKQATDPDLPKAAPSPVPNFVIIFCDDLGYGDVGWLGPVKNRTPNIDSMAAEGACFTDFYCTSGVCSPSRASLMTGCYPLRVGMHKSSKGMFVLVPKDRKGLHPDEITIAEVLKPKGYKTACIGKWHLGDQPEFLPTRQGFDCLYVTAQCRAFWQVETLAASEPKIEDLDGAGHRPMRSSPV